MQVSESGPVQSALPLLGLEEGVESRYHGASAGSESHCFPSLNEGFQPPWCCVYQLLPEKSPGWGVWTLKSWCVAIWVVSMRSVSCGKAAIQTGFLLGGKRDRQAVTSEGLSVPLGDGRP